LNTSLSELKARVDELDRREALATLKLQTAKLERKLDERKPRSRSRSGSRPNPRRHRRDDCDVRHLSLRRSMIDEVIHGVVLSLPAVRPDVQEDRECQYDDEGGNVSVRDVIMDIGKGIDAALEEQISCRSVYLNEESKRDEAVQSEHGRNDYDKTRARLLNRGMFGHIAIAMKLKRPELYLPSYASLAYAILQRDHPVNWVGLHVLVCIV
jgi:hypothetical protein